MQLDKDQAIAMMTRQGIPPDLALAVWDSQPEDAPLTEARIFTFLNNVGVYLVLVATVGEEKAKEIIQSIHDKHVPGVAMPNGARPGEVKPGEVKDMRMPGTMFGRN